MKYIEATFTITDREGNAITDTLMLQTIKDILCEYAGEAGFEAFEEQSDGIVGYVQKQMFNEDILCQNINALPFDDVKVAYNLRDAEDKNWNETWEEQGFEPITIEGKCVIHDTIHPAHTEGKDITDVVIDTKQAFGTGSHETTHMIIKELFEMDLKGKSVLDCGCGTGILSIISSIKRRERHHWLRHRRMERGKHKAQLHLKQCCQRQRIAWRLNCNFATEKKV